MEKTSSRTVATVIDEATTVLIEATCDRARDDAVVIVAGALSVSVDELDQDSEAEIAESAKAVIDAHVARRSRREPLAYITGWCEFRGLRLMVDQRVSVPDESSSPLVDAALGLPVGARVHDVGTGSGALALAIKHEGPDLSVSGSDISVEAIEVARANAQRLGLDVAFDVADGLPAGSYDLVIANLPYLGYGERSFVGANGETVAAVPELVDHMPEVAVFAGGDALAAIRSLLHDVVPGTKLALQHAPGQAEQVRGFFAEWETSAHATLPISFTIGLVR